MLTLLLALAALVLAAVLVKLLAGLHARWRFLRTAVVAEATVLSVAAQMAYPSRYGLYTYSPRIRFAAGSGRVYEIDLEPAYRHLDRYARGDRINVKYDPTEPTTVELSDLERYHSTRLVLRAVGVAMFTAMLALFASVFAVMSLLLGTLI
jgi:hypothetical protein